MQITQFSKILEEKEEEDDCCVNLDESTITRNTMVGDVDEGCST